MRVLMHGGFSALSHFFRANILDVGSNTPDVSERISKSSHAIAPELILNRPQIFSSGESKSGGDVVHILYVQHHADGRASERKGTTKVHLRLLVGQHEN